MLQIKGGMEDLGGVQWELLGCLILGWFIVYLIIWKGLHSSGKVGIETFVQLWLSNKQIIYIYRSSLGRYQIAICYFYSLDHLVYRSFPIFCNGNSFGACFDPSRCFYGTLLLCTGWLESIVRWSGLDRRCYSDIFCLQLWHGCLASIGLLQ